MSWQQELPEKRMLIMRLKKAQSIRRSGKINGRCGTELLPIIHQSVTDVNNFSLYHRETAPFSHRKNGESGRIFLRVGQNFYPWLRQKQAVYTKYRLQNLFAENSQFHAKTAPTPLRNPGNHHSAGGVVMGGAHPACDGTGSQARTGHGQAKQDK